MRIVPFCSSGHFGAMLLSCLGVLCSVLHMNHGGIHIEAYFLLYFPFLFPSLQIHTQKIFYVEIYQFGLIELVTVENKDRNGLFLELWYR